MRSVDGASLLRVATALKALGFLWTLGASAYLVATSAYHGAMGAPASMPEAPGLGQVDVTLMTAPGAWLVGLVIVVTVLAGVPLGVAVAEPAAHPSVTWSVGGVMGAFSVISSASIGWMYLPSVLVLFGGAALSAHGRRGGREEAEAHSGAA